MVATETVGEEKAKHFPVAERSGVVEAGGVNQMIAKSPSRNSRVRFLWFYLWGLKGGFF